LKEKKRILFITWDDPAVTYMEGLFVPIFAGLTQHFQYEFHVVQFSWATEERVSFLKAFCNERAVKYTHIQVYTKPVAVIGKYVTLHKGSKILLRYIKDNSINIVLPRSTMPAKMVLSIFRYCPKLRIVFDADGLPIEERIDFAGLKKNSLRYQQLKKIEKRIISAADLVLVRTHRAKSFLLEQYKVKADKFFVVKNGRDEQFFHRFKPEVSEPLRMELGIPPTAFTFVYCGSIGPQYGVEQMLYIYRSFAERHPSSYFLVLTNQPEKFLAKITESDKNIIIRKLVFSDVPRYLSIAQVGFAIRKASLSMRGVAPIKLGEYMLTGLPVIASGGIGDTDEMLKSFPFAFVLPGYDEHYLNGAIEWTESLNFSEALAKDVRDFGIKQFGLEESITSYHQALSTLKNS
jgi:glycosyltransferase involved in cell wall biosynthesis